MKLFKGEQIRKILSLSLCIIMVLGIMPATDLGILQVFAAETTEEKSTEVNVSQLSVNLLACDEDSCKAVTHVYTGYAHKPKVTVSYGGTTLTENTDYTVNYSNNTNASTGSQQASVIITGSNADRTINGKKYKFTGSVTKNFTISPVTIDSTNSSAFAITLSGGPNSVNANLNNLQSSVSVNNPYMMNQYTGQSQTPKIAITYTNSSTRVAKDLVQGTDFTVSYTSDSTNTGDKEAIISFLSNFNYTGGSKITIPYRIPQRDITGTTLNVTVDSGADLTYRGAQITPKLSSVSVPLAGSSLTMNSAYDYSLSYGVNTYAGTGSATSKVGGSITITPGGNFTGSPYTYYFTIEQLNLVTMKDRITMIFDPESRTYDATSKQPTQVFLKYTTTDTKKDYTIDTTEYDWKVVKDDTTSAADDIEVTATGKASASDKSSEVNNVIGSYTDNWSIKAKNIADTTITAALTAEYTDYKFQYTGNVYKPGVVVTDTSKTVAASEGGSTLVQGRDYKLTYKNNINAGTATIVISGINNYRGSREIEFEIEPVDISNTSVTTYPATDKFTYTGKAIKYDSLTVYYGQTVLDQSDYNVTYSGNTNVGTARITIKPTSSNTNFINSKVITFKIVKKSVADSAVEVYDIPDQEYTGKAITPAITVLYDGLLLKNNTDYTVRYKNNVNIGTATAIISGMGDYDGTLEKEFNIVGKSLLYASVSEIPQQSYTGSAIKPKPIVVYNNTTLTEGTDYTLSYKNNINSGKATCIVTGIGTYAGTVNRYFNIVCNHKYMTLSYIEPTYTTTGTRVKVCTICGHQETDTIAVKKGTISLSAKTIYVKPGGTAKISISNIKSSDYFSYVYSSLPSVADVYGSGSTFTINAYEPGVTTLVFSTVSGAKATCTVNVRIKTTKLQISKSKLTLRKGRSYTLATSVRPTTSTQAVTFSSSNPKVATVSLGGRIKARRKGKTTITVTSGNKTKICKVTVK